MVVETSLHFGGFERHTTGILCSRCLFLGFPVHVPGPMVVETSLHFGGFQRHTTGILCSRCLFLGFPVHVPGPMVVETSLHFGGFQRHTTGILCSRCLFLRFPVHIPGPMLVETNLHFGGFERHTTGILCSQCLFVGSITCTAYSYTFLAPCSSRPVCTSAALSAAQQILCSHVFLRRLAHVPGHRILSHSCRVAGTYFFGSTGSCCREQPAEAVLFMVQMSLHVSTAPHKSVCMPSMTSF